MAVLDGHLFGDELLGELDRTDSDTEDRETHGQTDQRCVQAVLAVVLVTGAGVLPGPEQVDRDECDRRDAGEAEPERNIPLGALLCLGAFDGPAVATVDNVDTVEIGAQGDQLVASHRFEFLIRVLLWRIAALLASVAHDLAPIHNAAPTTATIPAAHMKRPSEAGPMPPRP